MRYIFALLFAVSLAFGQRIDLKSQSRNADFSAHAFIKPWVIGTTLPATCSVGDAFFDSDATAGQNVYACTATNVWTLSSGTITGLTASRALQSDGSGNIAVSSVTSTELGYLSGVTSALQTQLNGKLSSTPPGSSGDLIYNNAGVFGALAPPSGSLVGTTATQTLTNKTLASLTNNIKADSIHEQVRNDSGGTLTAGTVVYVSGYNVGLDVATVAPADADNAAAMPAVCIIDVTLSNNATGTCLESGTLRNVDTSSFSVGDVLYVSTTAGVWTATRPSATDAQVQKIGMVMRSHATLGIVQVFGAGQAVEAPNSVDLGSGELKIPNGTTLPVSCVSGQQFQDTDATSGQQHYLCEAGTWVLQGDGGGGGGGLSVPGGNGMVAHIGSGSTANRTITAGTGMTCANGDGVSGNPTCGIDTAVVPTKADLQAGSILRCAPASASGANYTCSMSPALGSYTDGMVIEFEPDVNSSAGAITVNIDSLGSANIKQADGSTDPGAATLVAGRQVPLRFDGTVFRLPAGGGGGASALDDLTDVTITSATEDDALTYQGSAWINRKAYVAPAAYSSRPAANTVMPGAVFTATDAAYKTWVSDGSAWQPRFLGHQITEPPLIADWTAVNSPTTADVAGMIDLSVTSSGANQLFSILRAQPSSPYTITMEYVAIWGITSTSSINTRCGFMLTDGTTTSSKSYIFGIGYGSGLPVVELAYLATYSGTHTSVVGGSSRGILMPSVRLRLSRSGTTLTFAFWTGTKWQTLTTRTDGTDFTTSHVGYGCYVGNTYSMNSTLVNWTVE